MRKIVYLVLITLLPALVTGQSGFSMAGSNDSLLHKVAGQDVPPAAPGIATAIIRHGELSYQQYLGFASLEDSLYIDANTRFNIASNGKQFTALAILLLAQKGTLSLKDDIRKYLPGLFSRLKYKITIEQLLTHRSGIRDVYDLWALQGKTWWKNSWSNKDAYALLERQSDVNFKPGTRYMYSNSNYMLLADIIEKATGQSFTDYTSQIFERLGMKATRFENNYATIKGPIAKPYFNFSTWSNYAWIWNACGDGNLFTTPADLIAWEKAIQGKPCGIPASLINKSQALVNPAAKNYGYGLEFGSYKNRPYRFHEGATGAWKATVIRFGDTLSLFTLTNSGKVIPSSQTRQMADVWLGLNSNQTSYETAPKKAGKFISEQTIAGIYQTADEFTFQFAYRDSSLFLIRTGRNDIRLERESSNCFHQWNDPAFKLEFLTNQKKETTVTAYYTTHAPYTLKKISADFSKLNFRDADGSYINNETGVSLVIAYDSLQNYLIKIEGQDRQAIRITPSKFICGNYRLEFNAARKKPFIVLHGDRIRQVKFVRTGD